MLIKVLLILEYRISWQCYWIYRPAGVWWHNGIKIPTIWACTTLCPDFSQTGYSLRSLYIANLEGKKTINLNPLVKLIEFELSRSGLHEVPRSISHISKTIRILDLSYNHIATLENMENIVFPNLSRLNLMKNCIYHLNHISLKLPKLSYITLYQNSLTHLDDMSTCQWGMASRESWISITLHGNPWHCNGSMIWPQSSLCSDPMHTTAYYIRQPQAFTIDLSRLMCHSPEELHGKHMVALNESEFNNLKICSKGEYYQMDGLSFH